MEIWRIKASEILRGLKSKEGAIAMRACLQELSDPHFKSVDPTLKLSPDQAVALILDSKLSVNSYEQLRQCLLQYSVNVLPSYDAIYAEKVKCYPPANISDRFAHMTFKDVLDYTAKRLLMARNIPTNKPIEYTLISKWGCDGSGGHSN